MLRTAGGSTKGIILTAEAALSSLAAAAAAEALSRAGGAGAFVSSAGALGVFVAMAALPAAKDSSNAADAR